MLGPIDQDAPASGLGDLPPGTSAGEYRLAEPIGRGAFGTVYRAVHALIGKEAAVKVLDAPHPLGDAVERLFIAEAQAVNRIRHPNVVDIFGFGELSNGRKFCVMELLVGETLRTLSRRVGALPSQLAIDILSPLADALDHAHRAGILHRDLKPTNVFLHRSPQGRTTVKLLDFGISKDLSFEDAELTAQGKVIGTPAYMAPERWSRMPLTAACDIYSLGVMAYELLTGQRPFSAQSRDAGHGDAFAAPIAPSELDSRLPAAVDEPLLAMVARSPSARPKSATAAINELRRALQAAPTKVAARGFSDDGADQADSPTLVWAKGAKLAAEVAAEVESRAQAPKRGRARGWWLLASSAVLAATVLALGVPNSSELAPRWLASTGFSRAEPSLARLAPGRADGGAAPLEASECSAPAKAPRSEPSGSMAEKVALTLDGAPPGALLHLDDTPLGPANQPLWVPRSVSHLRLRLVGKERPKRAQPPAPQARPARSAKTPSLAGAKTLPQARPQTSMVARELEF